MSDETTEKPAPETRESLYREALERVLHQDSPWSLREVITRLADSVDHLLGQHNCDHIGHEGKRYAVDAARALLLPAINDAARALAAPVPQQPASEAIEEEEPDCKACEDYDFVCEGCGGGFCGQHAAEHTHDETPAQQPAQVQPEARRPAYEVAAEWFSKDRGGTLDLAAFIEADRAAQPSDTVGATGERPHAHALLKALGFSCVDTTCGGDRPHQRNCDAAQEALNAARDRAEVANKAAMLALAETTAQALSAPRPGLVPVAEVVRWLEGEATMPGSPLGRVLVRAIADKLRNNTWRTALAIVDAATKETTDGK